MNKFKLWYAMRNAVLLSAGMGLMTSCASSFFKTPPTITIEDIVTTTNEEGDLVITITFTDDLKEPLSFIVPQGESGNGIANITQTESEDGNTITVTITYTDETMPPLVFNIKNGLTISAITSDPHPDDPFVTVVTVTLSNGEVLSFDLPRPQDGKDGNGITGVEHVVEDDGSLTVTIHFSDMEDVIVSIPAGQRGADGVSVSSITMVPSGDGTKYIITFFMSNGTTRVVEMPRATKWLTGNGVPSNSLGIPGDFYYDLEYNVIYYKDGNTWVVQLDFNDQIPDKVRYKVNFSTNATEAPYPSWGDLTFPNEENKPYYLIPEGHHFFAAGYDLPVPTRTGYTFDGWYTHAIYNINLTRFTNLIPVYNEMTLYARWI
jgi:uncharacterized repeat protein (TIGR02543 family)